MRGKLFSRVKETGSVLVAVLSVTNTGHTANKCQLLNDVMTSNERVNSL